jgi:CubicO group peptidase (beta-lactamase class C family)
MALRSLVVAFFLFAHPLSASAQPVYFPDTTWEHKTPADSGLNPALLKEAVDFAVANETKNPRDLVMNHYQTFGREPFGYAIGPIRERGEQTGLIVHRGYVVAAWGEPTRVDMTHSVTKSFLSTLVGMGLSAA